MTKARQQIVGHFVAHGALTPTHAIALDTDCPRTARLLRRMRRHGAIAEAAQKVGNAAENVGDAAQKAVE